MLQLIGKYINRLLLLLLLFFLFVIFFIATFVPSLIDSVVKIEKLKIDGTKFSIKSSIEEIVSEEFGKSLFNFKLSDYKLKLEELDWIKRVTIKRQFPDTIYISVIENKPYAIFIDGINRYLIDEDGDIITINNDNTKYVNFLKVTGSYGNLNYSNLIREINISYPEILEKIIEVEFVENRRWNLILKENIKIKLPENNSIIQLEKLKDLDQKIFSSNIIEIDLREIGRATIKVPGGEELKTGLDEV